jgi:hypothetical protein
VNPGDEQAVRQRLHAELGSVEISPTPIERFRGQHAPSRGGNIYTFDGAVRAVECALALMEQQPTLHLTVHAGELQFAAGSISGPAADIAATAVTQSPAGQVTVTSVVKDLALGSRLNLAVGPTVALPGGEELQLFLARPLGRLSGHGSHAGP